MRTQRLLAALLGLALLGLTPILASPSAVASSGSTGAATALAPVAPAAARAKLPRQLNDRSVRRGSAWFIKGRVTPEGSRKVVIIKRKVGPHKAWRTWKRVRADRKGRFAVRIEFPSSTRSTWFYQGAVKSTAKYRAARTDKIYTACRRPRC
ncbi:MAG TPA: hypothetical protein VMF51_10585 [Nocardioides sp.]|jgi:hypothetical protein|uniref:hypothetical protein n=1 Tax=Nocardioides sp. TaxID=35761 RepID=UPI002C144F45|nr:hypothetical protein [Nocardioides sp.]HTW15567.1 hypothetical protein [Nocardioides sp.]